LRYLAIVVKMNQRQGGKEGNGYGQMVGGGGDGEQHNHNARHLLEVLRRGLLQEALHFGQHDHQRDALQLDHGHGVQMV